MARERVPAVQPPLFPLGFDPRDVRPEVTAWDLRRHHLTPSPGRTERHLDQEERRAAGLT